MIVILFVSVVVVGLLVPFALSLARVVSEKQALDQAAYSLGRAWIETGKRPAQSESLPGIGPVAVTGYGNGAGCSAIEVIVSSLQPVDLAPPILGGSLQIQATGSASLLQDAYRLPDAGGVNCDNAQSQ